MRARRVVMAVAGTALFGATTLMGGNAEAGRYFSWACDFVGYENSPSAGWTYVSEIDNCDSVQAKTYVYLGGGQTTSKTASGLVEAKVYKGSTGTYSGGAAQAVWNGVKSGYQDI